MRPRLRLVLVIASSAALGMAGLFAVRGAQNPEPPAMDPPGADTLAAVQCVPATSWIPGLGSSEDLSCLEHVAQLRGAARCTSRYFYSATLVSASTVVPTELRLRAEPRGLAITLTRADMPADDPSARLHADLVPQESGDASTAYSECGPTGCAETYAPAKATTDDDGRIARLEIPGRKLEGSDEWYIQCVFQWAG